MFLKQTEKLYTDILVNLTKLQVLTGFLPV